jgi:hypothetical protein
MRRIYLTFFILLFSLSSFSQNADPQILNIIGETSLDSLTKYVRELSGEDSVFINGKKTKIDTRVSSNNDLAADYIKQKLLQFGLSPVEQTYSSGKNILATKTGNQNGSSYYIICAHYDAVTNYCADDNASGCAAVLESARILVGNELPYTIVFAFWDEEEIGALGSQYFADSASNANDQILGVINLEMFGWDSNNDGKFEIHVREIAKSVHLADKIVEVVTDYSLNLSPIVINPGTTGSDHNSFWVNNYSAVVFSEVYYNGNFNPYYHTVGDRIDKFNMPYFYELSKLSVGVIATLASDYTEEIEETGNQSINIYPNPASNTIRIQTNQKTEIQIFDLFGRTVLATEVDNTKPSIDVSGLNVGYFVILAKCNLKCDIRKLIIVR